MKTRLGPSAISGIGLFADEDIKAGTVTWTFMAGFDQLFSPDDIDRLPEPARSELMTYAYRHAATGHYVYCLDNARFMNHAEKPNTRGVHEGGVVEGYDVAVRDVAKGEELTCDYHTFDETAAAKLKAGS